MKRKVTSTVLDCIFSQPCPLPPCDTEQPQDKPPDWFTSYLETVSVLSSLAFGSTVGPGRKLNPDCCSLCCRWLRVTADNFQTSSRCGQGNCSLSLGHCEKRESSSQHVRRDRSLLEKGTETVIPRKSQFSHARKRPVTFVSSPVAISHVLKLHQRWGHFSFAVLVALFQCLN